MYEIAKDVKGFEESSWPTGRTGAYFSLRVSTSAPVKLGIYTFRTFLLVVKPRRSWIMKCVVGGRGCLEYVI